jgi:hypothetical protein
VAFPGISVNEKLESACCHLIAAVVLNTGSSFILGAHDAPSAGDSGAASKMELAAYVIGEDIKLYPFFRREELQCVQRQRQLLQLDVALLLLIPLKGIRSGSWYSPPSSD